MSTRVLRSTWHISCLSIRLWWRIGARSKSVSADKWRKSQTKWSQACDLRSTTLRKRSPRWKGKRPMNLTSSTASMSSSNCLKLSKRMRILNKWKRWRLLTRSTKRNYKNYTKRNCSMNKSNWKFWRKIKKKWKTVKRSTYCTWQSSMRKLLTLYYKNLSVICQECKNLMKSRRKILNTSKWSMKKKSLCKKKSNKMSLRRFKRSMIKR